MKRRKFINSLGKASLLTTLPLSEIPFTLGPLTSGDLSFGVVADVHKDLIPDADARLEKFISEANSRNVDFIIQLGDFCMVDQKNEDFLNIWKKYAGKRYHVLGNHDMDRNSKKEVMDFWGMEKTYYSYDLGGFHFIVLDANFLFQDGKYSDYNNANFYVDSSYRTFINPEQIEWLEKDLARTSLPTIVFSHQSLWHHHYGVRNRLAIQKILEDHSDNIITCMNGHNHQDFHAHINGINYLEVNSMSYYWMADKYKSRDHFPAEDYEQYSNLPHIAPYEDALYAFVTLTSSGMMEVEGVRSQWVDPSPSKLGMPVGTLGNRLSAQISDYRIKY